MSGAAAGPVLVINSGSSSLKYQLVVPDTAEVLASGLIEQIGEPTGRVTHTVGGQSNVQEAAVADHGAALASLREQFALHGPDLDEVQRVLPRALRPLSTSLAGQRFERRPRSLRRVVEHRPHAQAECNVLPIEPRGMVDTGDAGGAMTAADDVWI